MLLAGANIENIFVALAPGGECLRDGFDRMESTLRARPYPIYLRVRGLACSTDTPKGAVCDP